MIDRTLQAPLTWLRYIDVVLVLSAAPVLLLVGVSALGYGAGAATWIALRAVGVAFDLKAGQTAGTIQQVSLGLGYRLTRVLLLAGAIIFARKAGGAHGGLAALLVILVAFTVQLTVSIVDQPASRH
jgi:hypothetical protein